MFTALGVAIFRVTLCDCAQIFVKKATIYENYMTQFVFSFLYTDQMGRVKRMMWDEKIPPILCDVTNGLLQCKLNKVKINYLEKWSDKYICWQLISILLLLMINT